MTTARASLSSVRQDDVHAVIRVVGEWDLANADLLAEQLDAHERAGRRFVRLDLSGVSFLDCTCLDVIATAHHRFLAARGTLVLTGLTPRLTRLLRLAGLDRDLLTTKVAELDGRGGGANRSPHAAAREIIRPA